MDEPTLNDQPTHRVDGMESQPAKARFRMWAAHCPFRKTGSPVLGTMGRTIRPVVVMEMETWSRLCREIPQLAETQFEVGSFD